MIFEIVLVIAMLPLAALVLVGFGRAAFQILQDFKKRH